MDAVKGKDIVWLYRIKGDTDAAFKIAFQTGNDVNESISADLTDTKDGGVRVPGALEADGSMTSLLTVGDEHVKACRQALRNFDKVQFWQINKAEQDDTTSEYNATYYEGYFTDYSQSAPADDLVEITLDFALEGEPQEGTAPLTADQSALVQYAFESPEAVV